MKKFKTIRIGDDISMESFHSFSEELEEAETSKTPVKIMLASHGGDAYAALAYAAAIRLATVKITIFGYGIIASAAVLILAAGDHRIMTDTAWVMVHEDSSSFEEGIPSSLLLTEAKHQEVLEKQWNTLLALRSNTSESEWARMHKETTYLTAMNCLCLGLIDEVV